MRRLPVVLASVAVLAAPTAAHATTVQRIPFATTVQICNGDFVQLSGSLLTLFSATQTPSGGFRFSFQSNPQAVSGVDLTTGTVFHGTGVTRQIVVDTPPGGATVTAVDEFRIQATGGAQSDIVTEVFHLTVVPDGAVTVLFDKPVSTC